MPNGDFESFVACPVSSAEIEKATGWSSACGTPDYYNGCAPSGGASVPLNFFGYQQDKTGSAYIGLYTYNRDVPYPDNREFAQIELDQPLTIGTEYHVSFDFSFTLDNNEIGFACDKLGVLFTSQSNYSSATPAPLANFAHVYTNSIVQDTVNWYHFESSFIADSAYTRVILGNFFDDQNTNLTVINQNLYTAYYFIDNVCVSSDAQDCLASYNPVAPGTVFPNPVTNGMLWVQLDDAYKNAAVQVNIYSVTGQLVKSRSETTELDVLSIDVSSLAAGQYYLQLSSPSSTSVLNFITF